MGPEITVATTVDVAWLQGQTKGSADVEIEFGGLATGTPIHIGFAIQQLAQARGGRCVGVVLPVAGARHRRAGKRHRL